MEEQRTRGKLSENRQLSPITGNFNDWHGQEIFIPSDSLPGLYLHRDKFPFSTAEANETNTSNFALANETHLSFYSLPLNLTNTSQGETRKLPFHRSGQLHFFVFFILGFLPQPCCPGCGQSLPPKHREARCMAETFEMPAGICSGITPRLTVRSPPVSSGERKLDRPGGKT